MENIQQCFKKSCIKIGLGFTLFIWAFHAYSLSMNGVAPYSELRKDYYIAALLLENPTSDKSEILSSRQHKQMRLLVTADRWTPRLWQKQWLNNIAINNEPIIGASQLQSDITFFTQLPEDDLRAGDLLVIDYQEGQGTKVVLNNRVFIQTKDERLFHHLVKTWIGKLPPSREFKNQILSLSDDETIRSLSSSIQSHTVSVQRVASTANWYTKSNEVTATKSVESSQIQLAKAKEKEQEKELEKLRKALANAKKEAQKAEAEKAKQARIAKEKELARQRLAREKAAQEKRNKQLQLAKKKTDREQKLEQFYYKDLYQWQLRQAIRSSIVYPEWAKQFQEQGVVEARFTLTRDGRVADLRYQDESVSKMLSNEVASAIEKAVKKLAPPSQLSGSQWSFSVLHEFSLRGTAQAALVEPSMPKHMRQEGGNRNGKVVAAYMDDVRKRIVNEVKYPAEAVVLRKRGKVSLFLTINSSGKVTKVFDRYTSKHPVFRTALVDAIKRAAPLPPLPKGIGKNELTIDVEYEFKR